MRAPENIEKKIEEKTKTFATVIFISGPGAIIGVGDCNEMPCPLIGLVPSKLSKVLLLAQIEP